MSSKPDDDTNGGTGGTKSGNGKRHSTSKVLDHATMGKQLSVTTWLAWSYLFLVCLDCFGLIDLPPLIEIRVSSTPLRIHGGQESLCTDKTANTP